MRKAAYNICIALTLITMASTCYGGSITFGPTIDVYGGLKLKDNSICFPDNTCMTTALINDGNAIWGQITGLISNQTDLQNQLNLKEDKSNKGVSNGYASLNSSGYVSSSQLSTNQLRITKSTSGYSPLWQTNWPTWSEDESWYIDPPVIYPQYIVFTKYKETSTLDISWTDNVGTYDLNWCNVGIFIDEATNPVCFASFLGTSGYVLFNQQSLHCNINLPAGMYSFKVKHRSQHCAYGNYPVSNDSYGTQRQLLIREVY